MLKQCKAVFFSNYYVWNRPVTCTGYRYVPMFPHFSLYCALLSVRCASPKTKAYLRVNFPSWVLWKANVSLFKKYYSTECCIKSSKPYKWLMSAAVMSNKHPPVVQHSTTSAQCKRLNAKSSLKDHLYCKYMRYCISRSFCLHIYI